MRIKEGQVYSYKPTGFDESEVEVVFVTNKPDKFGNLPIYIKKKNLKDKKFVYSVWKEKDFVHCTLISSFDEDVVEYVNDFTRKLEIDYILDHGNEEDFYRLINPSKHENIQSIRYDFKYNKKFLSFLNYYATKRLPLDNNLINDPHVICSWDLGGSAIINLCHSMGYGDQPVFTLVIYNESNNEYIRHFYPFLFEDESLILHRPEIQNN